MIPAEEDVENATKPSQEDGETIGSTESIDYDESDEVPEEDFDSDSDYGRPHKSKGKRIRGRLNRKSTEEDRMAAALEARRKRMRLNHGTPDSNEKNPKHHLFGPPTPSRDPSATASPTPSKPASGSEDVKKKVNGAIPLHSPAAGGLTRMKRAMQAEGPAARPSLVVKLKTSRLSATMGVDIRGKHKATRNRAMTKDEDMREEEEEEEEEAAGEENRRVTSHGQTRETKSTIHMTRQRQDTLAATAPHNATPRSPQPKKNITTRPRRHAIASPFNPPEARQHAPAPTSKHNRALDPHTHLLLPPSSPTTHTPVSTPPPPLHVASPPTLAPYPPMPHRSTSPFTRGARIALENLLADHQSDPSLSLIDLVEELDDTRPIVNDWEHVTVMKGGSWIYQVMRDVWEEGDEAASEMDGEGDEVRDEDVDTEGILERVGEWVDREVGRLGGGSGGA